MKPLLLVSSLLFLVSAAAPGVEEDASLLQQANAACLAKDYDKAASLYEKVRDTAGPGAGVLYNLGNARCRLGDYGPAILAYEQALALQPRAADIRKNLELAREAAAAFDDSARANRWMAPLRWLSLNEWTTAGAVALGMIAAVSLVRGFFPRAIGRAWLRWLTAVAAFVFFASIAALALRHAEFRRAIVLTPEAKVRLSPFETADSVATLTAGRAVEVEGEHEEFYRIQNGWVAKEDAGLVLERPQG